MSDRRSLDTDSSSVAVSDLPIQLHIKFSVIVPVFNGADTISQCLTAIINQDYPQDCFEVIVVNDGSTDNTLEIVKQFSVKIIDLPENKGRIIARKAGAEAALYDSLVFNDVRVIPERRLLRKIFERKYLPLMPDVIDYDGSPSGYSRLFYLLRRKIYAPYYPLFKGTGEIFINSTNFDKMPKGTTNLACSKSMWLACQPADTGKYVNDDTRILQCVTSKQPLLRTSQIKVNYLQRTDFWSVMHHVYGRGPRFMDYYLRRGGRYFGWYMLAWLLIGLLLLAICWMPGVILWSVLAGMIIGTLVAVWLSKRSLDVFVVLVFFPPLVVAFGLGILRGQFMSTLSRIFSGQSPTLEN